MNRMKHLLCVLLVAALGSFTFKANAYTERNMLQKAADESTLKNVLVMKQAWVPYPAYTDRAAWDSLMGPNKQRLIEAGEKLLKAGDIICFPANEKGSHVIANASKTEKLVYIDFGTANRPDIVHFTGTNAGMAISKSGIYNFTK